MRCPTAWMDLLRKLVACTETEGYYEYDHNNADIRQ
jgi:hypothetical protein